ncbi:MAG: sulfite exporter TauE/SafE family protein [Pseudomonadales bacterium]
MTISFDFLLLAITTYLFAGVIKGTVGIGLPTAAIGILAQFTEPRVAMSLVVFPILISNIWQVLREGEAVATLITYWRFALVLMLSMGLTTLVTASVGTNTLLIILGTMIILFSGTSLLTLPPELPKRYDKAAQIVGGVLAGVLGGLTAIWSPPMVIYLLARRVDKNEFVRAAGMLFALGSIPLGIGYWHAGLLSGNTALLSLSMIVPSLIGYTFGEIIRRHMDPEKFRYTVLVIFALMGVNLIRRALF